MTERTWMIAGPQLDDHLAVLGNLYAADLEIVATIVTLASLPACLAQRFPEVLISTG
jgi:hypothetical protein